MGSGEVAIVALSTMISLKVTFSDGLGGNKPIALMTDSSFSYLGIEYEEAVIWVVSVLCGAIVPLFAHFSVLLHAFSGIIEN